LNVSSTSVSLHLILVELGANDVNPVGYEVT